MRKDEEKWRRSGDRAPFFICLMRCDDYLRALISASTFVTMASVSPASLACGMEMICLRVKPFAIPIMGFLEMPGTCFSRISNACVSFMMSPTVVSSEYAIFFLLGLIFFLENAELILHLRLYYKVVMKK